MNVIGKVSKASLIRGRDGVELELRLAVEGGELDVHAATSSYVGAVARVVLDGPTPAALEFEPIGERVAATEPYEAEGDE